VGRDISVGTCAFSAAWNTVAAQVSARCLMLCRDRHEAQELYQLTAVRAWRGHDTFRGESAYLTWVMRILDREAARLAGQRNRRASHEITLDPLTVSEYLAGSAVQDPGGGSRGDCGDGGLAAGWVRHVLADAEAAGEISAVERRIVAERLARPAESWPEIAARLGMTATACAVAHSRAVPKLRVFLFTARPVLLGGAEAVAEAFSRAKRDTAAPLTKLEAEAFEHLVIRRTPGYRRRGSQAALRGACAKVARRMGMP
jgi:DNA-directed RNA polymerase specialized sigma24 family protein